MSSWKDLFVVVPPLATFVDNYKRGKASMSKGQWRMHSDLKAAILQFKNTGEYI